MRDSIIQTTGGFIGSAGILNTVATNSEVQSLAVALVSSLIIQVILKVSNFFMKKKDTKDD